jgi:cytochrome c oxidase subunit IV
MLSPLDKISFPPQGEAEKGTSQAGTENSASRGLETAMVEHAEKHHVLSFKQLGAVLAILLLLTGVTVGVSYVDLGFFNVPVALAIATTKVLFVLLFFMHLKYEGPIIVISFISTVIFLIIMISFTFWDVAYR